MTVRASKPAPAGPAGSGQWQASGAQARATKGGGVRARIAQANGAHSPETLLVQDAAASATTMTHLEQRFAAFRNHHAWWRAQQAGKMEDFDREYEAAVARLRKDLGRKHALVMSGKNVKPGATFSTHSPADSTLTIGEWAAGKASHVDEAVAAARKGFASWSLRPWQERVAIIEKAADLYEKHFFDLCAVMTWEAGKTRYEASIDVDEAVDFLRFYALTMREMNGFDMLMGSPLPGETCRSVAKPWGVFGVVCPFNFPVAITTGMTVGALITGNTAILKPSGKGCLSGWWVFSLLREAGVPADALHFLTAADHDVSNRILEHPGIDGLVLTGGKAVGLRALQASIDQARPRPVIAEMGGKNPIVVSDKADLDKAVQGVFRSAFGFSGQKCSACSRVYVHKKVAKEFTERLVKLTEAARVGPPWEKESYMGPVIEAKKVATFVQLVDQVRADGGAVLTGGHVVESVQSKDGKPVDGHYVRPTLVTGLPADHRVFREEFFLPFAAILTVPTFEQGIVEANAVEYGLTAGCFTENADEQRKFFERVQAGVTYLNRASGGSTAAVVNGQSFVGWKLSGTTGKGAGGRYYLTQFLREQSQTVVVPEQKARPDQ